MDKFKVQVGVKLNQAELISELNKIKNAKTTIRLDASGNLVSKLTQATTKTGEFLSVTDKLNKKTGEQETLIRASSKATQTFAEKIKEAMVASTLWAVAMGVLYGTLRKVKEGVQFVYDLDNQMKNIQMVTGYTNEEIKDLARSYNRLAGEISSNTMAVAEAAEEWLRQGRSVADTNLLIETSQIFAKVGMLDNKEAVDMLTSAINGYQMSAQQAMSVVDKMSAIDVNAAVSTQKLAVAMAQTASSAKIAGKIYARTQSNLWVA